MSDGIELNLRGLPAGSADDDFQPLVKPGLNKQESAYQRFMLSLDERVSVKLLTRIWGPRLEFVVRLMLVATFLDDSFHTVINFSAHTAEIGEHWILRWLASTSSELVSAIAIVALLIGLLAQSVGSISLLALFQPDNATKALIGWTIAQPLLYAQLSNSEFVAESLSLLGGLLMVRAHLVPDAGAVTQLIGRMMLPIVYMYHAGLFLLSAFTLEETGSFASFVSSLSMFVVYTAVLVGLAIGSSLVAAGLKSRLIALVLAIINLGYVFYEHPFFRFVWRKNGKWVYDEENMSFPSVALPTDVGLSDFEPEQIYDLHRYYFFLGLSTSGALLLLAQYGPGKIAAQKDEVLLPVVARNQD